jgi:glycosyltransferase involved in cell wall biosynthesis
MSSGLTGPAIARRRPYGIEVVSDPAAVFAPGAVRSVLSPILRRTAPRELRRQCAHAAALAFVTQHTLQQAYPPPPGAFATYYSSIELGNEAFIETPRPARPADGPFRLLLVGSLEHYYKGPDVLIEAVARLSRSGLDLRTTIVGDGRCRGEIESLARERGVADRIDFVGQVPPGPAVRAHLDRADLFVLPSRTEGLPRAMIEAMARSLPCIGSTVGGIPELLDPDEQVPPGDASALANKLRDILHDPERRIRLAASNLAKARGFHADVLRARRRGFYEAVRDATQRWMDRTPAHP